MTATCAQCHGRHLSGGPLHLFQLMEGIDQTNRIFLHERCVGAWHLTHPLNFLRHDSASSIWQPKDAAINLGVSPICEFCDAESSAGIFIKTVKFNSREVKLLCSSCGFRVVPGSALRVLSLFSHDPAAGRELEPSDLRELLDALRFGLEMNADFDRLRKTVSKFTGVHAHA